MDIGFCKQKSYNPRTGTYAYAHLTALAQYHVIQVFLYYFNVRTHLPDPLFSFPAQSPPILYSSFSYSTPFRLFIKVSHKFLLPNHTSYSILLFYLSACDSMWVHGWAVLFSSLLFTSLLFCSALPGMESLIVTPISKAAANQR